MTQEKRCSRMINGIQCGTTVTGEDLAAAVLCKPCFSEVHTQYWRKMQERDKKHGKFQAYGRSAH